jgi:hypothetical protein
LTPEEKQQVMTHLNGDTYRRHYMPTFIDRDCQSIYFGTPPQDDLVRRVGGLHHDTRAHFEVAKGTVRRLEEINSQLLGLKQKREACLQAISKAGYRSAMEAQEEGDLLWVKYEAARKNVDKEKKKLSNKFDAAALKSYWKENSRKEIDRQLKGIPRDPVLVPDIEYEIPERGYIAKLMFMPLNRLTELWQLFQLRADITKHLTVLCKRRETPSNRKRYAAPQMQHSVDDFILSPDDLMCPFCLWGDEQVPERLRRKEYSRIDALGRHVAGHLRDADGLLIHCPYPDCCRVLSNTQHFLGHANVEHGLQLPPETVSAAKRGVKRKRCA